MNKEQKQSLSDVPPLPSFSAFSASGDVIAAHRIASMENENDKIQKIIPNLEQKIREDLPDAENILQKTAGQLWAVGNKLTEQVTTATMQENIDSTLLSGFAQARQELQKLTETYWEIDSKLAGKIRAFKHLNESQKLVTEVHHKSSLIRQLTPEEKLTIALDLESKKPAQQPFNTPLSNKEKRLFLKYEEALSNTAIISCPLTQVEVTQLAVLLNSIKNLKLEKEKELFERPFYLSYLLREKKIPDAFKLVKRNGFLFDASPQQRCEAIINNFSTAKNPYFLASCEVFKQRLEGIQIELMTELLEQRNVSLPIEKEEWNEAKWENMSQNLEKIVIPLAEPDGELTGLKEEMFCLSKKIDELVGRQVQPFSGNEMQMIEKLLLDEGKIALELSKDSPISKHIGPIKFSNILRFSIESQQPSQIELDGDRDTAKLNSLSRIQKLNQITSKGLQKASKSLVDNSTVADFLRIEENIKEEFSKEQKTSLDKPDLVDPYFKKWADQLKRAEQAETQNIRETTPNKSKHKRKVIEEIKNRYKAYHEVMCEFKKCVKDVGPENLLVYLPAYDNLQDVQDHEKRGEQSLQKYVICGRYNNAIDAIKKSNENNKEIKIEELKKEKENEISKSDKEIEEKYEITEKTDRDNLQIRKKMLQSNYRFHWSPVEEGNQEKKNWALFLGGYSVQSNIASHLNSPLTRDSLKEGDDIEAINKIADSQPCLSDYFKIAQVDSKQKMDPREKHPKLSLISSCMMGVLD